MARFIYFLALLGFSSALEFGLHKRCDTVHPYVGLTDNFSENIAHAIHSMTVQGLRLFNSKVTEKNNVPTVNHNISAPDLVVPYAPDDQTGSDFNTETMNIIDQIMSHIGMADDGLGPYWSPIERVVHNFHMWDLWYKIKDEFETEVRNNPPKQDVCDCLTDVGNNGIRAAVQWVAEHYKSGTPITLLNRPIPKLSDAPSWQIWKDRLLHYYDNDATHDAAIYIYCATKDF